MAQKNTHSKFITYITTEHVGKMGIKGHPICFSSSLGRVLSQDVGKRVFLVNGIYQVENDGQRNERLKEGTLTSKLQSLLE